MWGSVGEGLGLPAGWSRTLGHKGFGSRWKMDLATYKDQVIRFHRSLDWWEGVEGGVSGTGFWVDLELG